MVCTGGALEFVATKGVKDAISEPPYNARMDSRLHRGGNP